MTDRRCIEECEYEENPHIQNRKRLKSRLQKVIEESEEKR